MEYFAHISESGEEQTVKEHLFGTAGIAGECICSCGLEDAAFLAGLLHDLGKFTDNFQKYLLSSEPRRRGTVIHTFQGCRLLLERYHEKDASSAMASELIAYAVGAHHGLFDCVDDSGNIGLQYRTSKEHICYQEAKDRFLGEVCSPGDLDRHFAHAARELLIICDRIEKEYVDDKEYCFQTGLLARLLLSAVINGDRQDTAAFLSAISFPKWPEDMTLIWNERLSCLEERLSQMATDSAVSRARGAISRQCKEFASAPCGIFRLNVPTGGGKTLASLRFALAHAAQRGHQRIIFTTPLLSILEQNARVIRDFVGDDSLILEHHSNVIETEASGEQLDERELLCENWNSPVIITTLVQLLNTMFSGKTTAIRRFQALCNSVIVIDEVQTVPTRLISMFILAIRFLAEQCRATVVLCSATQPYWAEIPHPLQRVRDIVPYDPELWKVFDRTKIESMGNARLEEIPEKIRQIMEKTDSLLVVCNTKKEAEWLYREADCAGWKRFHLSAAMCMQHRRDTVSRLFQALAGGDKVLCISTQVIEAGVDISFGCVIRLAAGMDSVIQSAGRCNRNGESAEPRPVYLLNCTDEKLGMLREIQEGKDAALHLVSAYQEEPEKFCGELSSDKAISYYYCMLYQGMSADARDYPVPKRNTDLVSLLSVNDRYASFEGVENYCLWQAFKTAGEEFSVFGEDTVSVLVPYGEGSKMISGLCSEREMGRMAENLRRLSGYTVSLYSREKKRLEECGGLISLCGGSILVLRPEFYSEELGLTTEAGQQEYWEV